MHINSKTASAILTCVLLAGVSGAARAQSVAQPEPQATPTVETTPAPTLVGPRVDQSRLAPVANASTTEAAAPMLLHRRSERDVRWMIVGGGMLVGGSIIGGDAGDIVSITGLVIGLIGVYRYLN